MEIERRAVMKVLAGVAMALSGLGSTGRSRLGASRLALRRVDPSDAPHLQAIMNACVLGTGAFHGECSEWALAWAVDFIRRCPETVVLTVDNLPVAFHEVPTIRSAPAPLAADATNAEREKYALRERNRTTFRLTAAGVRADVLSLAEAVAMFRRVLYYAFRAAHRQGFESGECYAPWEQHPKLARKWTDYPGCELVEAPSISAVNGRSVYWLRWRLDDVIAALALEGAGEERLDVA